LRELTPLYRRLLGDDFDRLPPEIRAMHGATDRLAAAGRGSVERGRNPLARLVAGLFGLPPAARDVPVRVTFTVAEGVEIWERDFDGARFRSRQEIGRGRLAGLLVQRFGPFAFGLAVPAGPAGLSLEIRGMEFLGLPLPRALAPRVAAGERVVDGRFTFDVRMALPLVGLLVHYRGWLTPQDI